MSDAVELGETKRKELALFLRAARSRTNPTSTIGAAGRRRRVPGLRREEVAERSGISVAWYTWLEQARPIHPSIDTLTRIATALGLHEQEQNYLFQLAGHPRFQVPVSSGIEMEQMQRLLNTLEPSPALLLDSCWDVLCSNRAANKLFGSFRSRPENHRNLIWLLFTDPAWKSLHDDWTEYAHCCVGQLRRGSGMYRSPRLEEITQALRQISKQFRTWWDSQEVLTPRPHRKVFHHPRVGTLRYDLTVMTLQENEELRLLAYVQP